jgi:hypothetical protein
MKSFVVAKNYKPKWTCWRASTVTEEKRIANRKARRAFKQYLKTGSIKDFNRSQKMLTQWDFD